MKTTRTENTGRSKYKQIHNTDNTGKYFEIQKSGDKQLTPSIHQTYFTQDGSLAILKPKQVACAHCRQPLQYGDKNYIHESRQPDRNADKPKEERIQHIIKHYQEEYGSIKLGNFYKAGNTYSIDVDNVYTADISPVDIIHYKEHGKIRAERKKQGDINNTEIFGTRTTQTHIFHEKCFEKIKTAEQL